MKNTTIQWADDTCNPTMGCDGCELWNATRKTCYAGQMTTRFGLNKPGWAGKSFEDVKLYPGRMAQTLRWADLRGTKRIDKSWLDGMPRLIFVSDMSDALSKKITFKYLRTEIVEVAKKSPHHYLWLTKQPQRMAEFSDWLGAAFPDNLWAGTSITTQATTARIKHLARVDAAIKFLSIEPQWEMVDISDWLPALQWVIQGGESGSQARPFEVDWQTGMSNQCKKKPYFLKQLGSRVHRGGERWHLKDGHGGDWEEWTQAMKRREFPKLS